MINPMRSGDNLHNMTWLQATGPSLKDIVVAEAAIHMICRLRNTVVNRRHLVSATLMAEPSEKEFLSLAAESGHDNPAMFFSFFSAAVPRNFLMIHRHVSINNRSAIWRVVGDAGGRDEQRGRQSTGLGKNGDKWAQTVR